MSTNTYTSLMNVKSLSIDEASLIEGRETFTRVITIEFEDGSGTKITLFSDSATKLDIMESDNA